MAGRFRNCTANTRPSAPWLIMLSYPPSFSMTSTSTAVSRFEGGGSRWCSFFVMLPRGSKETAVVRFRGGERGVWWDRNDSTTRASAKEFERDSMDLRDAPARARRAQVSGAGAAGQKRVGGDAGIRRPPLNSAPEEKSGGLSSEKRCDGTLPDATIPCARSRRVDGDDLQPRATRRVFPPREPRLARTRRRASSRRRFRRASSSPKRSDNDDGPTLGQPPWRSRSRRPPSRR